MIKFQATGGATLQRQPLSSAALRGLGYTLMLAVNYHTLEFGARKIPPVARLSESDAGLLLAALCLLLVEVNLQESLIAPSRTKLILRLPVSLRERLASPTGSGSHQSVQNGHVINYLKTNRAGAFVVCERSPQGAHTKTSPSKGRVLILRVAAVSASPAPVADGESPFTHAAKKVTARIQMPAEQRSNSKVIIANQPGERWLAMQASRHVRVAEKRAQTCQSPSAQAMDRYEPVEELNQMGQKGQQGHFSDAGATASGDDGTALEFRIAEAVDAPRQPSKTSPDAGDTHAERNEALELVQNGTPTLKATIDFHRADALSVDSSKTSQPPSVEAECLLAAVASLMEVPLPVDVAEEIRKALNQSGETLSFDSVIAIAKRLPGHNIFKDDKTCKYLSEMVMATVGYDVPDQQSALLPLRKQYEELPLPERIAFLTKLVNDGLIFLLSNKDKR